MLLSEGQMSDYKGAALMLPAMPKAKQLLADKGYDADWFHVDLPRKFHPAAIRASADFTSLGAGGSNMRSAELVGVAQTIACCGEIGGVGRRREIA